MPASVLFLTVVFGLSACGPRVTNRNIDALNAQMDAGRALSIKEVEAILGQPTRRTTQQIEQQTTRELPVVRYYYEENGKTAELHFVDNKLQNRVPHFGDQPPTAAPLQMKPKPRH